MCRRFEESTRPNCRVGKEKEVGEWVIMNEILGILFLFIQVLTVIAGIIAIVWSATEKQLICKIYMLFSMAVLALVCFVGYLYNMGVIG